MTVYADHGDFRGHAQFFVYPSTTEEELEDLQQVAAMALMKAIDHINQSYGVNKIGLGIAGGTAQAWHNRCENRSGNYLTDLEEVLRV